MKAMWRHGARTRFRWDSPRERQQGGPKTFASCPKEMGRIVGVLRSCPRWRSHSDRVGVGRISGDIDTISVGEEGIEALNEERIPVE